MLRCDAILLAAGLSRRMGADNKLLLKVMGKPMIAHVTQTYLSAITGSVTVITGYQSEYIERALADLPVNFVHNPDFAAGQQSSVVEGLRSQSHMGATLMGLGDQPLLRVENLLWLLHLHQRDPSKVTVPYRCGRRGNPIVIPSDLRPMMLANPKSAGCRKFTRDNPHLVTMVDTASDGFFADVDTPEDYHNLTEVRNAAYHGKAV